MAAGVGAGAAIAGGATYYSEYENSTTVERTETYDAETEGYDQNNEYWGEDGQEGYGEGMYEDGEYGEYEYEGEYYQGEQYEGDEHAGDSADIMSASDDPGQQQQPSAGQEMSATQQALSPGFESFATKEGYGQPTNDADTSRATRNAGNGTATDEESGCCECGSCDCCGSCDSCGSCGRCDCCGCCIVM